MKFSIESDILTRMVTDLAKAVPAKPAQPILQNFLFEIEGGMLRITASDGEISLRGVVRPEQTSGPASVAVPAKILLDLLKTLPSGPITLNSLSGNAVTITWGTGESSLPVYDARDYIETIVPVKGSPSFSTTSDVLSTLIAKTLFAVATDDTRPALTGLFFDLHPGLSYVAASDTRKLVCHAFHTPDIAQTCSFVLPAKAAAVLKGILPKEQPMRIVFDEHNARFMFGSMELTTRLVSGKFPAYRGIIPTNNENVLNVRREVLLGVLRRMAVLADKKTTIVKVALTYNSMMLSAEDVGMSTRGTEKLECDYDGKDLSIGLNIPTVVETVSNIASENVEIRFMDESHAVLLQPSEGERKNEPYEAVVLPYKLR